MRRSTKHRLKQRALYLGVVALCALLAVWLATWGEAADTRRYMAPAAPVSGVALTASTETGDASVLTLSVTNFNMQCGAGENCMLAALVGTRGSPGVIGCTCGATDLDQVAIEFGSGNGQLRAYFEAGLTGTCTVTCSWTSARNACLHVLAFKNVDQTNPLHSPVLKDENSGSGLVALGGQILGVVANTYNLDFLTLAQGTEAVTPDAGQTTIQTSIYGGNQQCVSSTKAGTGTVDMGYTWTTSTAAAHAVMNIKEVP